MKNHTTKNLTIAKKLKRMKEAFPGLEISKGTIWRVLNFNDYHKNL